MEVSSQLHTLASLPSG